MHSGMFGVKDERNWRLGSLRIDDFRTTASLGHLIARENGEY